MANITIGNMSKITGVSRDCLRNYEKKGLLSPSRDNGNEYRRYDEQDLLRVLSIQMYRSMGLSLETTQILLETGETDIIKDILATNERELETEIANLTARLKLVRDMIVDCESVKKYLGIFTVREMNKYNLLPLSETEDASGELTQINKNRVEGSSVMRSFIRRITFSKDKITGNEVFVGIPTGVKKTCVYTVVKEPHDGNTMQKSFMEAMMWTKANGIHIDNCAFVRPIFTNHTITSSDSYLEIFAPLKDENRND